MQNPLILHKQQHRTVVFPPGFVDKVFQVLDAENVFLIDLDNYVADAQPFVDGVRITVDFTDNDAFAVWRQLKLI